MQQYHTVNFSEITLNILYLQIEQFIDANQSEFATYSCNLSQKMAKMAKMQFYIQKIGLNNI